MEYLILILSLAGIVLGADFLVAGSVGIARKFNISEFVIGAAIVGIGTSMPELTVSLIGAIEGNSNVAIGNVVGSNIFNVLGILGVTTLIMPLAVSKESMKFELPFCIGTSILLTLLVFNTLEVPNHVISKIDGIVLIIAFIAFMWISFKRGRNQHDIEETNAVSARKGPSLWLSIGKTIGGLAVLIISCDFFIDNAVSIAKEWGVDDAFISITLIACGTSLPELAASITAALRKNADLSLGNIIGSNIFNICLILGVSSLASAEPLQAPHITLTDYFVMIIAAVFPFVFGFRGKISRWAGVIMLISFVAYNIYLIKLQTP